VARPKERETDRAVVCNLVADVAATMVAKGHEYGDSYLGDINKAIELADPLNDRVLYRWLRDVEEGRRAEQP